MLHVTFFDFEFYGVTAQAEETIEEQIINREQREKLLRQVELLEKQCRTEKRLVRNMSCINRL